MTDILTDEANQKNNDYIYQFFYVKFESVAA